MELGSFLYFVLDNLDFLFFGSDDFAEVVEEVIEISHPVLVLLFVVLADFDDEFQPLFLQNGDFQVFVGFIDFFLETDDGAVDLLDLIGVLSKAEAVHFDGFELFDFVCE